MVQKRPLLTRLASHFRCYLGAHFPRFVTAETWDRQYARGDWDILSTDDDQMGHHMVVLGYVLRARPRPRILDVGCGAGRLFEFVQRVGMPFERYVGIDISAEAIKRARALAREGSEFKAASAEEFTTDERFDAIVFNEVAWYFKNPGEVLSRYAGLLREEGKLILSMYEMLPARSMWASVARYFDTVDAVQVKCNVHSWQVRMLVKRT